MENQKPAIERLWSMGIDARSFNGKAQESSTVPSSVLSGLQTRTDAVLSMLQGMKDTFYAEYWHEQPYRVCHSDKALNGQVRAEWENTKARDFFAVADDLIAFLDANKRDLEGVNTSPVGHANVNAFRLMGNLKASRRSERCNSSRNHGMHGSSFDTDLRGDLLPAMTVEAA